MLSFYPFIANRNLLCTSYIRSSVRFLYLTAVSMKMAVFYNVALKKLTEDSWILLPTSSGATMTMGTVTSASFYKSTLRSIPEDSHLHTVFCLFNIRTLRKDFRPTTEHDSELLLLTSHHMTLRFSLRVKSKAKQSRYTPWWRLGERRYSSYSLLTSALDGGEWSASRLCRALPRGKDPRYPLNRRLGGPQSWSGQRG
jgi:hypothetical protein